MFLKCDNRATANSFTMLRRAIIPDRVNKVKALPKKNQEE